MICSLCGRKLKSDKSIRMGYGPVCYKKEYGSTPSGRTKKNKVSSDQDGDIPYYEIPGQMNLEDYLNGDV